MQTKGYINFSVKIVPVKNVKSFGSGRVALYMQFIQSRSPRKFALGIIINESQWRGKEPTFIVEKGDRKARDWNLYLEERLLEVRKVRAEAKRDNVLVTYDDIKLAVKGKRVAPDNKIMFQEIFADFYQYKIDEGIAEGTLKNYRTFAINMSQFKPKDVQVTDINEFFVRKFLGWKRALGNENTTAFKNLIRFRTFLKYCRKSGYDVHENDLEDIRIKQDPKTKQPLDAKDVAALKKYYLQKAVGTRKEVLKYFLFSCETGIDYKDITTFDYTHIHHNDKGSYVLRNRGKTGTTYRIPLSNEAKKYIDLSQRVGAVFRTISNDKSRKHLKEVAHLVGINKPVTYHVARHTFATKALEKGVRINVLSEWLGHKKIRTTQLYAKQLISTSQEQIKLLNDE